MRNNASKNAVSLMEVYNLIRYADEVKVPVCEDAAEAAAFFEETLSEKFLYDACLCIMAEKGWDVYTAIFEIEAVDKDLYDAKDVEGETLRSILLKAVKHCLMMKRGDSGFRHDRLACFYFLKAAYVLRKHPDFIDVKAEDRADDDRRLTESSLGAFTKKELDELFSEENPE